MTPGNGNGGWTAAAVGLVGGMDGTAGAVGLAGWHGWAAAAVWCRVFSGENFFDEGSGIFWYPEVGGRIFLSKSFHPPSGWRMDQSSTKVGYLVWVVERNFFCEE